MKIRPAFIAVTAAASAMLTIPTARADEVFVGLYAHAVDTPLTLRTDEGGADVELGYRFEPLDQLSFVGKPSPYLIGSLNSQGDTSFIGGGLSWKLGRGPIYVRPEMGIVVHDGSSLKLAPNGRHLELGSRVLFAPGIGVGTRLDERVSIEASWVHISQGRIFNYQQNPGVDMWGARLNWKL